MSIPHVVVLGGGIAGLSAVWSLKYVYILITVVKSSGQTIYQKYNSVLLYIDNEILIYLFSLFHISSLFFFICRQAVQHLPIRITLLELSNRYGGWLHSIRSSGSESLSSSSSHDFLFEQGCRGIR